MEKKSIRGFILFLLCAMAFSMRAGASESIESEISYRRFTTLDGLPQMQTETVWQDSRGYIYIGTLSGFVRYDGATFTTFLGGRRENIVLFRETAGKVYAMGFVRQWRVDGKGLKMSQAVPEGRLINNLNAADLSSGYLLLEDRQEQNRALCRILPDRLDPVLESPLLDEMTPDRKMYVDSTCILIPTPRGLYATEDENVRRVSCKTDVFSVIRSRGLLLALAADGIYRVGKDSLTLMCAHSFDAPDYGLSVRENRQGQLLIADAHTIWMYDASSPSPIRQLASGFNLIRGLFIDSWNRLWAATYQGAYCFFHCNFVNHRLTDRNDIVRALASCGGRMFMGTLNGKVLMDGNLVSSHEGNFYAPGAAVLDGKVYMAGNGDIARIDGIRHEWLGLTGDRYRFVASAAGKLVIGASRSILSYDPASGRLDTLTTGIARPWCAAPGTRGRLWVSGNPGLFCLTGSVSDGVSVSKVFNTPTTPVITSIASGPDGTVCFALGDELYAIRDDQIGPMKELNPALHGHEIRSLHISPKGFLVVAAIDGLMVARLEQGFRAGDWHWFDSHSGFTNIEPLMGTMAESDDGTVWLAGLEEMVSFKPANLLSDNREAAVVRTPLPWWKRWWAILLAAAVLSFAVWLLARKAEQRHAMARMADLEREKTRKELQLQAVRLKAIPHFHSNVLSGIEYFIMNKSAGEAAHYLKLYSDFTNQTLSDIDKPSRSVASEIDYVRNYLELEKLRYGDRLQYRIDVAPDVDMKVPLPTMLLHTYCQNAVKHGIASKSAVGNVEVSIRRETRKGADGVLVAVKDDGVGRSEAARSGGYSTGQGLKILSQQISLYNQANDNHIEQRVTDMTDGEGRPAGTCFETWVPVNYTY